MISFIIPFCTIEKDKFLNLNEKEVLWKETNSANIVYSTIKTIKNINKIIKCEKEIILVDNSHTFPDIKLPNLKVVKGWQALPLDKLEQVTALMEHDDMTLIFENIGNLTMWVSLAFHCGIQHAKGEYVVLQHNDIFYHKDCLDKMIKNMEREELEYISVDSKKIWISTYILHHELLDQWIKEKPDTFNPENRTRIIHERVKMSPDFGGYVKTKRLGFADAYFFLCKRKFFDNYNVDWYYGDTNHGATIYCLSNDLRFEHLGPYWDNPNWEVDTILYQEQRELRGQRTYFYEKDEFVTHLKGGFSENKMSSLEFEKDFKEYLQNT